LSSGQTGNSGKKNKFEKIFWGLFQDEIKKGKKSLEQFSEGFF
jgi:hypothetical protein